MNQNKNLKENNADENTHLIKNSVSSSSNSNIKYPSQSDLLMPDEDDTILEDSNRNDSKNSMNKIRLYPIRWYLLGVLSLSCMMTSVYQMSFSSIQKETLTHFDMEYNEWNKRKVNLFSLLYNMNVIFAFALSYLIKMLGLAPIVDFGILCNFVGGWIRFGSSLWRNEMGFWICFSGQLIASFAQSSLSYSGTQFSSNWFGANERGISTTISSFSNLLGSGVAFTLNTMIGEGREWLLSVTLLIHALISTFTAILGLPFFRSKPPTPANIASANLEKKKISFFNDLWMLFTNVNAIILLITYFLGFGAVCSFLTLISQIVTPKGYDGTNASIFGLLIIFSGGFGAFIFSFLVGKTKRFVLFMWISGIGALVSLAAFTFFIRYERTVYYTIILSVLSASLGFFALPFVPLVMELACEITYPVAANVSQVTFGSSGTGSIILFVLVLEELQSKNPEGNGSMQNAMYVILVSFTLALVVFIFFRGKYKRTMFEAKLQEEMKKKENQMDESIEDYYEYQNKDDYNTLD